MTPENGMSQKTMSGRMMKSCTLGQVRGGKKMLSTDTSVRMNALSWLVVTNKEE